MTRPSHEGQYAELRRWRARRELQPTLGWVPCFSARLQELIAASAFGKQTLFLRPNNTAQPLCHASVVRCVKRRVNRFGDQTTRRLFLRSSPRPVEESHKKLDGSVEPGGVLRAGQHQSWLIWGTREQARSLVRLGMESAGIVRCESVVRLRHTSTPSGRDILQYLRIGFRILTKIKPGLLTLALARHFPGDS